MTAKTDTGRDRRGLGNTPRPLALALSRPNDKATRTQGTRPPNLIVSYSKQKNKRNSIFNFLKTIRDFPFLIKTKSFII